MKLIIVILLKENEQLKVKEISRFTRKLANEDFLEKLLRLKTETDFYKIIENLRRKNNEDSRRSSLHSRNCSHIYRTRKIGERCKKQELRSM